MCDMKQLRRQIDKKGIAGNEKVSLGEIRQKSFFTTRQSQKKKLFIQFFGVKRYMHFTEERVEKCCYGNRSLCSFCWDVMFETSEQGNEWRKIRGMRLNVNFEMK